MSSEQTFSRGLHHFSERCPGIVLKPCKPHAITGQSHLNTSAVEVRHTQRVSTPGADLSGETCSLVLLTFGQVEKRQGKYTRLPLSRRAQNDIPASLLVIARRCDDIAECRRSTHSKPRATHHNAPPCHLLAFPQVAQWRRLGHETRANAEWETTLKARKERINRTLRAHSVRSHQGRTHKAESRSYPGNTRGEV